MYICGFIPESINEGSGLRSVIFISGCLHNCKGCHSPETHNFKYGEEFTISKQLEIIKNIKNNPLIEGITLCGGDPFYSAKEVVSFITLLKQQLPNIDIWSYTGFTLEEILNSKNEDMIQLLMLCDVLIDGRYVEKLKDLTLFFKGSKNQRVIDVKQSLKTNCVVEVIL